jgi:hypothetical protein
MSTAASEYEKLVTKLTKDASVVASQMFGKACLKVNGKAFVAQHKETVVFKLTGPEHKKAMAVAGAQLWDPSGKARPMKEWVALPALASKTFSSFATAAMAYVASVA